MGVARQRIPRARMGVGRQLGEMLGPANTGEAAPGRVAQRRGDGPDAVCEGRGVTLVPPHSGEVGHPLPGAEGKRQNMLTDHMVKGRRKTKEQEDKGSAGLGHKRKH
eukprot:807075-Alexandrium_andersonii.AAC.1